MRRLIIPIIILSAVIAAKSKPAVAPIEQTREIAQAPEKILSTEKKAELSQEQIISQAYAKAQSLAKIESGYLNFNDEELEREIAKSQSQLSDSAPSSEDEAIQMLTEIRRQHVLQSLLAKRKIENLRRANL